jgi:hypothetical protein
MDPSYYTWIKECMVINAIQNCIANFSVIAGEKYLANIKIIMHNQLKNFRLPML